MMNMKKKMTTLILNVEAIDSTVKRLKSEGKNRYAHIEDSVQAEIDTLKLFKDRVEIEVQILKKQYNQTMNSQVDQNTQDALTKKSEEERAKRARENDTSFLMREFQVMKDKIQKLEKANKHLKENTNKKIELFNSKIKDVEQNADLSNKMNSSLRDLLNTNKSSANEIFTEMNIDQLSEFCHNQKRINNNLNLQLEVMQKKLKEQNQQVAIYKKPPSDEPSP